LEAEVDLVEDIITVDRAVQVVVDHMVVQVELILEAVQVED
jgi:hypothetical protein